jgi:hypothetical protein
VQKVSRAKLSLKCNGGELAKRPQCLFVAQFCPLMRRQFDADEPVSIGLFVTHCGNRLDRIAAVQRTSILLGVKHRTGPGVAELRVPTVRDTVYLRGRSDYDRHHPNDKSPTNHLMGLLAGWQAARRVTERER